MLKKFFSFAFFSLCMISFYGCGDDSSSSPSQPTESSSSGILQDSLISSSDGKVSSSSIQKKQCSTEGAFKWLSHAKDSYSVCENGFWNDHAKVMHKPGFNPCQFNFGAAWQDAHRDVKYYDGLDYVSVWLGDNDFYNFFEASMLDMIYSNNTGATPMIYAYVIAEFGKDHGLKDCDMTKDSSVSLCVHGADLIREYFADSILFRYQQYASGMRKQLDMFKVYGVEAEKAESIWLIEPDFYQYSESGSNQKMKYDKIAQENGGIPDSTMGKYFKQIVDTIKTYLPAAKIVIDISPWIADRDKEGFEKWFSNFDLSLVDYAGPSGGGSLANNARIRMYNEATWANISKLLGKPIIADAGYDRGGAGKGHSAMWDVPANINARIADGVVGVMQMDAALDYVARLDTIRPQITAKIPWCNQ